LRVTSPHEPIVVTPWSQSAWKTKVLADRDVRDAAAVPVGEVGDRANLARLEHAVRNADSHHEMPHGLALAALAADRADAVALRVDPPPSEVRAQPLWRDGVPALAREALDVGVGLPGILLALEPLDPLRLRLFQGLTHCYLQKTKKPEGEPASALLPACVLGLDAAL